MEYIILVVSLLIGFGIVFLTTRVPYDSYAQMKRSLKNDGVLIVVGVIWVLLESMAIAILLFAINNSIWHFDYIHA